MQAFGREEPAVEGTRDTSDETWAHLGREAVLEAWDSSEN